MHQRRAAHSARLTVSMSPDQHVAIEYMAFKDGHDIASRVVQDAVSHEIQRRLGEHWRDHVRDWATHQETDAV